MRGTMHPIPNKVMLRTSSSRRRSHEPARVLQLLLVFIVVLGACGKCPISIDDALAEPCIQIKSWKDFVRAISSSSQEKIIFCPFAIKKSTTDRLVLKDRQVALLCQDRNGNLPSCIIDADASDGSRIIQIKGTKANVVMVGFAFVNSGRSFSAVHVSYNVGARGRHSQIFCSCLFKGNRGDTRGVALRAEPRTRVELHQCDFKDNSITSSSIGGGIFNRGDMLVEGCTFVNNSGKGGAIGSSDDSKTTLFGNTFRNNDDGPAIFSHANGDFVDMGGNIATGNSVCNGIDVLRGQSCLKFNSDDVSRNSSPPPVPTPTKMPTRPPVLSVPTPSALKPIPSGTTQCTVNVKINDNQDCIPVPNFAALKTRIQQAYTDETLIFCPFRAKKPSSQNILISSSVIIACSVPHECRVDGPNTQIRVRGDSAQVHIQGFVFEGAGSTSSDDANAALHIMSGTTRTQSLCNCIFRRNKGLSRGVGLLTERKTDVEVINCRFERNESTNIGAAIFTRGYMLIAESSFWGNRSTRGGGAIGCASGAPLQLRNNIFEDNKGRLPIFLHEDDAIDLGGNIATGNNNCNGMVIQREGNRCALFSGGGPVPTTASPTQSPVKNPDMTTRAPRGYGGSAYFNYDMTDGRYGPSDWKNVKNNAEHLRMKELYGTLQRSLENKCERKDLKQSPINLCDDMVNTACQEHHQTRTHSGNVSFGQHVKAQILPSKLRLKYYPDRTPEGGPYPPEADFAYNWNGYIEVNHIDVKIPSEHTICGRRYPAEYSIYMMHPLRRQIIVMSILMEVDPNDKENKHFQKAIDEWQKEYDRNAKRCDDPARGVGAPPRRRRRQQQQQQQWQNRFMTEFMMSNHDDDAGDGNHTSSSSSSSAEKILLSQLNDVTNATRTERELKDTTPYGKGGWDPFHPSLERSLYHWGYWGSLTEPPCSTFVAWRVLTKPAYISQKQLSQLRTILFTNRNDDCYYTSVADPNGRGGVARPLQSFSNRKLYKCTVDDYVSDKEKDRMREETGNPDWCC